MRIISGKFKGRRFNPPAKKWPTRPTTDISKEGLFNILQHRIEFTTCIMLDLFGGTGNHSYEFISRGCKDVTYVDKFGGCIAFVKKTSVELGIEDYITIHKSDVFKFIRNTERTFSYIFAGPPYPLKTLNTIPDEIFKNEVLSDEGLFVLEHNPNHNFEHHPQFEQKRNYGSTIFSFFVNRR